MLTQAQTDFANKAYNSATTQEETGTLKQFPILLILAIILEAIQLLVKYLPLFHNRTPAQIKASFADMNIFQRLALRRNVRLAIKAHEENVSDYEPLITSGIKNAFAGSTDAELRQVLKDFS